MVNRMGGAWRNLKTCCLFDFQDDSFDHQNSQKKKKKSREKDEEDCGTKKKSKSIKKGVRKQGKDEKSVGHGANYRDMC